jgi:hypothetical protein
MSKDEDSRAFADKPPLLTNLLTSLQTQQMANRKAHCGVMQSDPMRHAEAVGCKGYASCPQSHLEHVLQQKQRLRVDEQNLPEGVVGRGYEGVQ